MSASKSAAVVGAGVLGRMLALGLRRSGWSVTVFDRDDEAGSHSCTWTGAGMLSPYCEREAAEKLITDLGLRSMTLWPDWLKSLPTPVFYREAGSIVVSHPPDRHELERLRRKVLDRPDASTAMRDLDRDALAQLEPELVPHFAGGLYFPQERHIDNRDLLRALADAFKREGVTFHAGTEVNSLAAHSLEAQGRKQQFDWVFDCRGMGASEELKDLRGVRGELFYLHAPDVHLQRPVRLMHPRYSIYIVPRATDVYVVGATMVESFDLSPISVRSSLELLTAAYSVHTGFAEARVLESSVNCRPGFPDNHPRFIVSDGLMRINGLFRHGFLITPALVEFALAYLDSHNVPAQAAPLWRSETP